MQPIPPLLSQPIIGRHIVARHTSAGPNVRYVRYRTSTAHVNEGLFHHLQTACVARGQTMDGLIPIYVAAIAGVHCGCSQRRDMVQLRAYVMEHGDALDGCIEHRCNNESVRA